VDWIDAARAPLLLAHLVLHSKLDVAHVSVGHMRQVYVYVRQIHALSVAQRAAVHHLADQRRVVF